MRQGWWCRRRLLLQFFLLLLAAFCYLCPSPSFVLFFPIYGLAVVEGGRGSGWEEKWRWFQVVARLSFLLLLCAEPAVSVFSSLSVLPCFSSPSLVPRRFCRWWLGGTVEALVEVQRWFFFSSASLLLLPPFLFFQCFFFYFSRCRGCYQWRGGRWQLVVGGAASNGKEREDGERLGWWSTFLLLLCVFFFLCSVLLCFCFSVFPLLLLWFCWRWAVLMVAEWRCCYGGGRRPRWRERSSCWEPENPPCSCFVPSLFFCFSSLLSSLCFLFLSPFSRLASLSVTALLSFSKILQPLVSPFFRFCSLPVFPCSFLFPPLFFPVSAACFPLLSKKFLLLSSCLSSLYL